MIMTIVFFFFYIFAFPINNIPIIDSSWIAFSMLLVFFIINNDYRDTVLRLICNKQIYKICGIIAIISLYGAINTSLSNRYDFQFIVTLIHQIISLLFGVFVVSYAIYKKNNIIETIIYSFFIQSIIQMTSMISPQFRDATNILRPESAIIRGQWTYTGIRGLGISGSAFFGLAISYGLLFVLWALNRKEVLKNVPLALKMLILGFIIVGGVSAGRTSLFGLIFALFIIIYSSNVSDVINKEINGGSLIASIACFALLVPFIIYANTKGMFDLKVFDYFSNYATEFIRTGHTTSGASLRHMYFNIDLYTFVFGDGAYGSNLHYYMSTDAGYMRVILYMGFPGIILLCWLQIQYLVKHNRWIIMAFLLVMQIKGEVIGFSIIIESMLLLYYFYQVEPMGNMNNMKDIVYSSCLAQNNQ